MDTNVISFLKDKIFILKGKQVILLKKLLLICVVLSSMFSSFIIGKENVIYIPIALDDINIIIPQKKPYAYIPPANSLAHTTITTTEGKKIRIDRIPDGLIFEGYENKIVLLEVYGHSCPHCIASIPGYNRLQAKYPEDVYVIAIESYGLNDTELKQYVIDHTMHYSTVSKAKSGNIINFISILTGWSPGIGVPWLTIYGRDGKIAADPMLGDIQENTVDTIIHGLL